MAAVLGVIKTMSHINEPPAVLGAMIGGALVGTFLGVLLAYGMAGPVAARMKGVVEEEAKYMEVIRAVLVTHLHGNAPQISVETGRKMAPNEHMPSFQELEDRRPSRPDVIGREPLPLPPAGEGRGEGLPHRKSYLAKVHPALTNPPA